MTSRLADDLKRLEEIRRQRQEQATAYFAANAAQWQQLRSLHVREDEVEAQLLAMLQGRKFETVLDLGTGTGRILELLAPQARQLWGLDQSRDMLAIARANLDQHKIKNAQVRQADIYALPFVGCERPISFPSIRSCTSSMIRNRHCSKRAVC